MKPIVIQLNAVHALHSYTSPPSCAPSLWCLCGTIYNKPVVICKLSMQGHLQRQCVIFRGEYRVDVFYLDNSGQTLCIKNVTFKKENTMLDLINPSSLTIGDGYKCRFYGLQKWLQHIDYNTHKLSRLNTPGMNQCTLHVHPKIPKALFYL